MEVGLSLGNRRLSVSWKRLPLSRAGRGDGGWFSVIREPTVGAWQRNEDIRAESVLRYYAIFACTTLVMSDVGKLALRLVEEVEPGVWEETDSPAFSPFLRKPNHYQTTQQFIESWVSSKLTWGNTYVLPVRDGRGVVTAAHVLDPARVTPLVAPSGAILYECRRDDLAGLTEGAVAADGIHPGAIVVPAREMFHDRYNCLFHPLVGLSPLYAAGAVALQGLAIQNNSHSFFANGSAPGGILMHPRKVDQAWADKVTADWQAKYSGEKRGSVAMLTDGMTYEKMTVNPVDAQLVEQLQWSATTVCGPYHVPPYLVDIGPPPPYANIEPVIQKYFSQCLQSLIKAIEDTLDHGLGLAMPIGGVQYGTEFDVADLIWMDTAARNKAAADGIGSGGMAPNEARRRFYGLGAVDGGESPYMQQQMFSLAALAARDAADPFVQPVPAAPADPARSAALETKAAAVCREAWGA